MCRCLFFMFLYPYFINLDSSDKVIRTVASLQDFIAEHAGGRASNGLERILDLEPTELHQRVPLIIGSAEDVKDAEGFIQNRQ